MRECDAAAILSVADGARVGEGRAAGCSSAQYVARVRRAGCGGGAVASDARQGEGRAASGVGEGGGADGMRHRGRRTRKAGGCAVQRVARGSRAGVQRRRSSERGERCARGEGRAASGGARTA